MEDRVVCPRCTRMIERGTACNCGASFNIIGKTASAPLTLTKNGQTFTFGVEDGEV